MSVLGGGLVVDRESDETSSTSFEAWVAPHLPVLHRFAARLVPEADVEDLLQDGLIRAWRRWSTFDAGRGSAVGWLLAIVNDQARRRRTRARPVSLPLDGVDGLVDPMHPDVDLERAVASLSERQRRAIDLYYFVGLDIGTCAEVMGCAEGTVKATLHQARARLHDQLREVSDD